MFKLLSIFLVILYSTILVVGIRPVKAAAFPQTQLLLSEVKTRYDASTGTDYDEFIELHNNGTTDINLDQYVLEYFNVTNPPDIQQPTQRQISVGLLEPGQHLTLAKQPTQLLDSIQSPFSNLSDTGGRLRLVTTEGEIIDEIAWTNTQSLAQPINKPPVLLQCNTSTTSCSANKILSYSRLVDAAGAYIDEEPQWGLLTPSPESSDLVVLPADEIPVDTPDEEEPVIPDDLPMEEIGLTCEGVGITEILPNPTGSDIGHEYIELYNPTTDIVSMQGCSLQTSANSKTYTFDQFELLPGAYVALYDTLTGLTLANAAGGTVWLLSPNEEVHEVVYAGNIDDDASWSYVGGVWGITYALTPNAANISLYPRPCVEGQVREDTSGQCRAVVTNSIASLATCKVGQERSPDTNRCRSVATTARVALTPCKDGQERNPETNRCRAVLGTTTTAPCDEGEERNPETNRCRKITTAGSDTLAAVTDVKSATIPVGPAWWIAGIAVLLALGYAVYEWRQDVGIVIRRLSTWFKK